MRLPAKIKKAGVTVARTLYAMLPFPGIARPVFIIGCGRSGTTIFGRALSRHQAVTYLNEPRPLWFSAYPETDIWTPKAPARGGKLALTETDVDPQKSHKLRRLFRFETIVSRRPVLIEKLPINNFRLRFIRQIFPDARFIHLYRNGLEVARSIETLSQKGQWFGLPTYKWDKLVEYATGRDDANRLPALCETDFEKGLLEWRLSTEAAVDFLRQLPDEDFFELDYEELIEQPIPTLSRVLDFLGLQKDPNVDRFVSDTFARKSVKMNPADMTEKTRRIGGKLLPLSMDGGRGLTRRSA